MRAGQETSTARGPDFLWSASRVVGYHSAFEVSRNAQSKVKISGWLLLALCAVLGARTLHTPVRAQDVAPSRPHSRIITVHDVAACDAFRPNLEIVRGMVE